MQLAVYMGITEIYLIGTDHHFHTSMNAKGEIIIDPKAKDYFVTLTIRIKKAYTYQIQTKVLIHSLQPSSMATHMGLKF